MNSQTQSKPLVSIGMPVFNGEKFIRKRLDSVIEQTFKDFELIISDNSSTDSTPVICEEYSKKDKRIRYFRQKKNMGAIWNFKFVLQEAKFKYFVWAAVDDLWESNFLKKNIEVLESNKNAIASMSRFSLYGESQDPLTKEKSLLKKIGLVFGARDTCPITGSYEKRVRTFFKNRQWMMLYAVYRTSQLRDSIVKELFVGYDQALILNALKHGDILKVDEVLFYIFRGGASSRGTFSLVRLFNRGIIEHIFPLYPFTLWCKKELGMKIFLKNIDRFIRLNSLAGLSLVVTPIRFLKKEIANVK